MRNRYYPSIMCLLVTVLALAWVRTVVAVEVPGRLHIVVDGFARP